MDDTVGKLKEAHEVRSEECYQNKKEANDSVRAKT